MTVDNTPDTAATGVRTTDTATADAEGRAFRWTKRALDIIVAGALLIATAPLFAIIAVVVRRDKGPALFRQRRVGTHGRSFEMPKFRSMTVDAESRLDADPDLYAKYVANGFKLPLDDDVRITRCGVFLRASHLDELPQLITVLRGDMSMVGPRPIVEEQLEDYRSRGALDVYLNARPGLTGVWQVSSGEGPDADGRVSLDVGYAEHPTLVTDLRVIIKTAGAVANGVVAGLQRRPLSRPEPRPESRPDTLPARAL